MMNSDPHAQTRLRGIRAVAARYASRFPPVRLVTIADLGGWPRAQAMHFGDGGILDQIYLP